MSATDIFLDCDIECLYQNMRFHANTCNICGRGGIAHATFSCPRCISVSHNTGHDLRLPYKKYSGKARYLKPKEPLYFSQI
jgi:hypothetical protein